MPAAEDSQATRFAQIRRLLSSRLEYLESAVRTAPESTTLPGPAPDGHVACSCARLEVAIYRDARCCEPGCTLAHAHIRQVKRAEIVGRTGCALCHGAGWRRRLVLLDGKGERDAKGITYDPYTYAQDREEAPRRRRTTGAEPRQSMTMRELDRALNRLAATWPALATGDEPPPLDYGWAEARRRRDRCSSYPALDQALGALRIADEQGHDLLLAVYCEQRYGQPPVLGPTAVRACYHALTFIERRMPVPIELPVQWAATDAHRVKAKTIGALREAGRTPRQIARELNVDLRKVKSVLSRPLESAPPTDALTVSVTTTGPSV